MATATFEGQFRCTNIGESAPGYALVSFQQERTDAEAAATQDRYVAPGTLSISLETTAAQKYFPGEVYTLTLAPAN
jgi:hypothetical protein